MPPSQALKLKADSSVERKGLLAFFPRAPLATLTLAPMAVLEDSARTQLSGGAKRPREPERETEIDEAPDYLQTLRKRIMRRMAESGGTKGPSSPVTPPSRSGAVAESVVQHGGASPPRRPPPPLPTTTSPCRSAATSGGGPSAAVGQCSACGAPSRFCVCAAADDNNDDTPPVAPSPKEQAAPATKAASDSASTRPAWVCNSGGLAPPSEDVAALRRQMSIQLLKLEKQGVWLTSAGNNKGTGSASR
jgi:hypothetical protein